MRYAIFDSFEIAMTDDEAMTGSHQGRCDDDVAWLVRQPHIASQLDTIGAEAIRTELSRWGAWDDKELADDDANRARIVWIAAGNIVDEPESESA